MREVGAFEAKNKLGKLLDLVERGEEVDNHASREGGRSLGPSFALYAPESKAVPPCGEFGSARRRASLAASTGRNGKLIATEGGREPGS